VLLGLQPSINGEFIGDDWTAFVLDPPLPVSAGGTYTVVLTNDLTGVNLRGAAINLYADGETDAPGLQDIAFRVSVTPAGEIRFPDGTRQATAFDGRGFALRQPAGGSSSPFLPVGPNPGTVTDTIEVSGTGQAFGPGTQLQVCVDITHSFSEDLVLTLEAPNGAQVLLAADEPGSILGSVNYTDTCFATFATTSIVVANSPLTGTWRPEGNFAAFEGSPIDGPWTLIVEDTTSNDGGTLLGWSLQVPVEGITFPDGSVQVSAPPDGHSLDSAGGVPANVVFVDKDGEVGIGTTTPGRKLDVAGEIRGTTITSTGSISASSLSAGTITGNGSGLTSLNVSALNSPNGSIPQAVAVLNSGNVGVGTTNPGTGLHLGGKSLWVGGIDVGGLPASVGPGIRIFNDGAGAGPQIFAYDYATGTGLPLTFQRSGGNVGVGSFATPPSFKFQVVGDAAKNTGASWTVASDIRLKEVSGSFARGLAALRDLQPISFHYQEGNAIGIPAGEDQVGVAAQDVQKLIPEAIVAHPSGYLHVNNDPIFWTVVNAVRELGERDDARDAEIERLRADNEELRERLAAIEALLAR
jgi:subtilisin-like proprotein convertase family protein